MGRDTPIFLARLSVWAHHVRYIQCDAPQAGAPFLGGERPRDSRANAVSDPVRERYLFKCGPGILSDAETCATIL